MIKFLSFKTIKKFYYLIYLNCKREGTIYLHNVVFTSEVRLMVYLFLKLGIQTGALVSRMQHGVIHRDLDILRNQRQFIFVT